MIPRRIAFSFVALSLFAARGSTAAAESTVASTAPVIDASTPQGQWLAFSRDALVGDPKKMEVYYKATSKAAQAVMQAMIKSDMAGVVLDDVIGKKFGRPVADKMIKVQRFCTDAEVAAAEVTIEKDVATIKVKGEDTPITLVRQGATWATDLDEDAEKTGADTIAYARKREKLLLQIKADIESGKISDAAALENATKKMVEELDASISASSMPAIPPVTTRE